MKKFAKGFITRVRAAEIFNSSVAIAYFLLLSAFPLLIIVGNISQAFGLNPQELSPYLESVMPVPVLETVDPIIENLLRGSSGGLLSVSIVVTLWSSSRGIVYIESGINKVYGVHGKRGYIARRAVAVLTLIIIVLLFIVFVILFSFGETFILRLIASTGTGYETGIYFNALKWPVTLIMVFAVLTVIYKVTPNVKLRLREAIPGALITTVLVMLLVRMFALYLSSFAADFSMYGALSAFFILMFWLNFLSYALLLGAAVNAAIHEYKYGPPQEKEGKIEDYMKSKILGVLKRFH